MLGKRYDAGWGVGCEDMQKKSIQFVQIPLTSSCLQPTVLFNLFIFACLLFYIYPLADRRRMKRLFSVNKCKCWLCMKAAAWPHLKPSRLQANYPPPPRTTTTTITTPTSFSIEFIWGGVGGGHKKLIYNALNWVSISGSDKINTWTHENSHKSPHPTPLQKKMKVKALLRSCDWSVWSDAQISHRPYQLNLPGEGIIEYHQREDPCERATCQVLKIDASRNK